MESINTELEIIRLLEKELEKREDYELEDQLKRLKTLAHTIERAINTEGGDYDVHKATNLLCKYLGILWGKVFNVKE